MMFLRLTCVLVVILYFGAVLMEGAVVNPRVAIAVLNSQTVNGSINFIETENGIRVQGILTGLKPGLYGFHVHELGDVTTCDTTGPHFDPHGRLHGGREHAVRHVGDFGNVMFVGIGNNQSGIATVDFEDKFITFSGQNNILGRALVLHEHEDDLGLGDHEISSISGNAGPRIACGVIGIRSGYWNSGIATYSSSTLVIVGIIFGFLNRLN